MLLTPYTPREHLWYWREQVTLNSNNMIVTALRLVSKTNNYMIRRWHGDEIWSRIQTSVRVMLVIKRLLAIFFHVINPRTTAWRLPDKTDKPSTTVCRLLRMSENPRITTTSPCPSTDKLSRLIGRHRWQADDDTMICPIPLSREITRTIVCSTMWEYSEEVITRSKIN